MLDLYYLNECELCGDDAKLMRSLCVRSADEVKACKNVIEDFFIKTENGYFHKKCNEELQKIYDKSEKARLSALKRWEGKRTHSDGNANGMLPNTQHPTPNNPKPTKKKINKIKQSEEDKKVFRFTYSKSEIDDFFEKFWKQWGGGSRKIKAREYFLKAGKDKDSDFFIMIENKITELFNHRKNLEEMKKTDKNILVPSLCSFSVWINEQRWEDEYPTGEQEQVDDDITIQLKALRTLQSEGKQLMFKKHKITLEGAFFNRNDGGGQSQQAYNFIKDGNEIEISGGE